MMNTTHRGRLGIFQVIFFVLVLYFLSLTVEMNMKFDLSGFTSPYILGNTLGKISSIGWLFKDTITNNGTVSKIGIKSHIRLNRTLVVPANAYSSFTPATRTSQVRYNKTIIFYNAPDWFSVDWVNKDVWKQCNFRNCFITKSQNHIRNASAIMFSPHEKLPSDPPISEAERNPDQAWVLFSNEAPLSFAFGYRHENWKNTMNWSMMYTMDADLFYPYGLLQPRTSHQTKDYGTIYRSKTKDAAWIVSHCGAGSRRDEYAQEMQEAGLKVDIFGKCSPSGHRDKRNLKNLIQKEYRFYLSFENAFCVDYITEKYFSYIDMDVVLVVRGGADYSRLLPKRTFIDAADFPSAKELVIYLKKVAASESLYTDYLKTKHLYTTVSNALPKAFCDLCERLNSVNDYRSEISDHVSWLHSNTCWEPRDIKGYHLYHLTDIALPMCFIIAGIVTCVICVYVTKRRSTRI